ncbi:unnamed protein product [Penicillium olsonii]|nr:unnamed protein product [Penicillium olsonii]
MGSTKEQCLGEDAYLNTSIFERLSLRGHVVVITGGARGIGLAMAFAVAEAGARVALVDASPNPHEHFAVLQEKCEEVRFYQSVYPNIVPSFRLLYSSGLTFFPWRERSDVTDYVKLKSTFQMIAKDFGRLDGLITAAGICPDQRFLERDPEGVKKCLEVNSLGTYYSAQLAVEQMVKQSCVEGGSTQTQGSIVMIASIAAHQASKDQFTSDYCMSKGAVVSLTKQLGVELAQDHVRVNCISPGYVRTSLTDQLLKARPALRTPFTEQPPMKRMGNCTDLMTAAVFLLSEASAYMTGSEMMITGGMHAGRIV